jgi:uncharacterized protein
VTPQEEQLLNSLVERVNQTQLQEKDPDAEELLNQGLGSNPDSAYILAQTVLVQNIALEQAKAQVAQLQQQVQQAQKPAKATSFLGNLLGHHDPAPPPQPQYLPPQQQGYMPPPPPPPGYDPQYAQPQYQQVQYAPAGQPSFMRGAMQTAAGVAAGALAFEGVEAVLHGIGGFGHGGYGMGGFGMGPGMGMMGGGMMGGGFERPIEENVVNNYYEEPGGHEHGNFDQGGGEERHFHESSDSGRFDQGDGRLSDASYNTGGNDQGGMDDGSMVDDSQDNTIAQDDGGGFDNGGGGFDDGGGGGGSDFS